MVLAFFDTNGLICKNFVPRGKTVNAAYITEALTHFLRVLKEKRTANGIWELVVSLGQYTCSLPPW
jgi:hypothetical protein